MNQKPIILCGMHRSGTSLLTRLLDRMGLFVGNQLCPETHESIYFQRINAWMMAQAGGAWDNPEPFRYVLQSSYDRQVVANYVRGYMNDPMSRLYWGKKSIAPLFPKRSHPLVWGWKDPVNIVTLPIWTEVYPGAKIIYVERHGVDVAHSLVARKHRSESQREDAVQRGVIERFWRPRGRRLHSPRCSTLEGAFSLWETYCEYGRSFLEEVPEDRKYVLKFEQLAEDPEPQLRRLSEFCGLSPTDEEIDAATKSVRKSRVYAFSETEQLVRFAEQVAPRLRRYGY